MTQVQARTLVKFVSESPTFLPRLQAIDDAVRVEYRKAVPRHAFDPEKAARMYRKLVDEVARTYLEDIGTTATIAEMFPLAARDLASRMLVRDFLLYHVKD